MTVIWISDPFACDAVVGVFVALLGREAVKRSLYKPFITPAPRAFIAGVALGGLVLDEPITPKIIVALALITSGILVIHWKAKKEAPAYPIRRDL